MCQLQKEDFLNAASLEEKPRSLDAVETYKECDSLQKHRSVRNTQRAIFYNRVADE